jgi:hypothetical protein
MSPAECCAIYVKGIAIQTRTLSKLVSRELARSENPSDTRQSHKQPINHTLGYPVITSRVACVEVRTRGKRHAYLYIQGKELLAVLLRLM